MIIFLLYNIFVIIDGEMKFDYYFLFGLNDILIDFLINLWYS